MFVSRKAAKAAGETLYYSGNPCKDGHIVGRYVSTRACSECSKSRSKQYHKACPSKAADRVRRWRSENREWSRLKSNECVRRWQKNNPDKERARVAKRRASKLSATPSWLSPVDLAEIEGIYQHAQILSRITGNPYDVDHIVPLQGENVCGLHVPWNLQAIPASTNRSKSNSTDQADCASVYDEEFDVWHLSQPPTSPI